MISSLIDPHGISDSLENSRGQKEISFLYRIPTYFFLKGLIKEPSASSSCSTPVGALACRPGFLYNNLYYSKPSRGKRDEEQKQARGETSQQKANLSLSKKTGEVER